MSDGIVRINCCKDGCGTFPMDRALYKRYKRTGETWSCPAGHGQHFTESTEQKLRGRISKLESKVERLEERKKTLEDRAYQHWLDFNDEKKLRKTVEQRILELSDGYGPVEVSEDRFMWVCECGSSGRAAFDTEREAWDAYDQHRENHCSAVEREAAHA